MGVRFVYFFGKVFQTMAVSVRTRINEVAIPLAVLIFLWSLTDLKFNKRQTNARWSIALVVLFTVLFAQQFTCFVPANAYANSPLDRFEAEIKAFEIQDKASPQPSGQTLFIGSSTFAHWKTLEQDFSDLHAINRGFGGATIPEINYYEKRLVAKYHPAKIVFYAGTNDIADGRSGTQVCADFVRFVQSVHKDVSDADIYFISMSVAPSRLSKQAEFDSGNALIRAYIKADPKLHYIDVVPVMHDGDEQLKTEYFGPDHLHMSPAGYAAWMPIIRSALASPIARGQALP